MPIDNLFVHSYKANNYTLNHPLSLPLPIPIPLLYTPKNTQNIKNCSLIFTQKTLIQGLTRSRQSQLTTSLPRQDLRNSMSNDNPRLLDFLLRKSSCDADFESGL